MRKLILLGLMAATALPTAASAQWRGDDSRHDRRELRQDRQDLRHDRRDLREDRRDFRHDRRAYVAPYRGWAYRTLTPGFQLRSVFWGPSYVVSDFGAYRLHAPRYGERWIRYGDDLVLVNVRNGRVIEVIRNRW